MIQFECIDVKSPQIQWDDIRQWIQSVAESYQKRCGNITYFFCSDDHILEVNKTYLNHDYYTDIITFDYTEGNKISGEIFISLDTVRSNSSLFKSTYNEELHRVIIHGVLHLVGINDKGPGEREIMEEAENKALAIIGIR